MNKLNKFPSEQVLAYKATYSVLGGIGKSCRSAETARRNMEAARRQDFQSTRLQEGIPLSGGLCGRSRKRFTRIQKG